MSINGPTGIVKDMSLQFTVDLESGKVSGYQSTWKDGGTVKAIVDSLTIKIIAAKSDGSMMDVFAISRMDGTVDTTS